MTGVIVVVLFLLLVATVLFVIEAVRTRGSLIALGLAAWVLAELVVRWPG
jgi:cell division protein FtsW (lipid II flippase)